MRDVGLMDKRWEDYEMHHKLLTKDYDKPISVDDIPEHSKK